MGVEIPSVFELNGEVIDAEGLRWAARNPALTRWFNETVLHWVADQMEKAPEGSVVKIDPEED